MSQFVVYDFLIIDQAMPLLTSEDRITRARELGFAGRVIGYAASLPDTLARRTLELGVERSIQKPESPYSLLETG